MLFTTKGDGIHCRFLELLGDLGRVGRYAWGAALLAHTLADLSTGTGRETTVGGFAPFLQVWSYYYLPLGRATLVCPDAVPLARRWLPLVSTATYTFQLDVLRRNIRDFPALLVGFLTHSFFKHSKMNLANPLVQVVWEPYADQGDDDQPWVVSGRPLFRRDIWVHCLNEIEPLCLQLAARTLGLHQRWLEETEPRGIGKKTRGKAKTVDWRTRFPDQYADWQRGGQLVESDAADSTAYLRRFQEEYGLRDFMRPERDGRDTLIGQLQGQLASTEVQLSEARAALETLRTAQMTAERTDVGGASSSRSVPAAEVASLQQQLSAAMERAERAERDLLTRTEELQSALAHETGTVAELTEQSQHLTELRSQLTQRKLDLPRDIAKLQAMLTLERRDLERQQARWEQERSRWELDREWLIQRGPARELQSACLRCPRSGTDADGSARGSRDVPAPTSESILATSSQHERNVRDATVAQCSTGSRAPMGPPALPAAVDQGEAESSRRAGPVEGEFTLEGKDECRKGETEEEFTIGGTEKTESCTKDSLEIKNSPTCGWAEKYVQWEK
ncbi:hypothetical protein Taro_055511 [Colocasia esculenta]|uniref:Aminotransferase-like plant mobile domain-containing protein n=1 Tax=Colocasia esculenta TaxID=4460 RepID=A0A843XTS5_COLES|nr:hypothetical protein [Colocasia esculenta]